MSLHTWCLACISAVLALIAPPTPPIARHLPSPAIAVATAAPPAAATSPDRAFPRPEAAAMGEAQDAHARTLAILHRVAHPSLRGELDGVADAILMASREHALDPELLLAMIHTESSFRPGVRSRAGAVGLMQLLPATARPIAEELEIPWSGSSTLLDPVANVRLGAWYLAHLRDDFDGDMQLAISAYNLGPSRVKRYLKKGKRPAWYAGKVEAAKRRLFRTEEAVRVSARNPAPSPNG